MTTFVRLAFGIALAVAAVGAEAADIRLAACEKCPYRFRISADGTTATLNTARFANAGDEAVLSARARRLMQSAADTRRRDVRTRPLMGWSSWNTFAVDISEEIILSVARAMATNGLKAAGYTYVNIDDGFFGGRDAAGHLKFHPRRFPNGLKGTVDGIHALGMKAGTYSDAGCDTCGSIWNDDELGRGSGLYGHDADDFALHFKTLGFDFIKVDYCGAKEQKLDVRARYTEIADALRATGRAEARLNLCRWAFPGVWAADIAESWRTTRDIRANWKSIRDIIHENLYLSAYVRSGHYNDLDMLEVGHLKGLGKKTAFHDDSGLTAEEEQTHFGLWCMMSSPLLLGCDPRDMAETTKALVTNPFLLAMSQNDLGLAPDVVRADRETYVLVKDADRLFGTARYVALYNASDAVRQMTVDFAELGLAGSVELFDLAERADLGVRDGVFETTVPPHATRFLRADGAVRLEPVRYEASSAYLTAYQEIVDAKVAGTAYYETNALARCGFVVKNLGGRADNDLVWPSVRTDAAGVRRLVFDVSCEGQGAFDVEIDGRTVARRAVSATKGAFVSVAVTVELPAGVHRVRLSNAEGPMPDVAALVIQCVGCEQ